MVETGSDGMMMPGGFEPGELPEGFERGRMPEGLEPGELPEGFEGGQMPEGVDPGRMPGGGRGGFGGFSQVNLEDAVTEFEIKAGSNMYMVVSAKAE